MFRTAELGRKIGKKDYERIAEPLRIEMIELQQALRHSDFPTLIVFAGVDGAGKNQTVNLINEWMDPRWIVTHAYRAPSDEERERPEFWRYWRDLPPRGKIGLFLRAWYSQPVLDAAYRRISPVSLDARLDRIMAFESGLAADGALIVKFWLHLSKKAQKRRLKELSEEPHESWRVTETDWRHTKMYDDFIVASERTILRTSTADAPWTIVEGEDERYREITVLTAFRDAALRHLETRRLRKRAQADKRDHIRPTIIVPAQVADPTEDRPEEMVAEGNALVEPPPQRSVLGVLESEKSVGKPAYEQELPRLTARLNRLAYKAKQRGISSVLVFEGWDAAGKGGTIRRITAALDARDYLVVPVAAPTDEEKARHYLWRFWRHLPRRGRVLIFDRSWYGRVLVERVEGLAAEDEWRRAYAEINAFEQHLIDADICLVKYWLHITPEEQLARFERRAEIPYKRWKLTDEDWRNRDRWTDYEAAITEMVQKTSTHVAPWTLVEANCKRHARLKALAGFCDALEARIKKKE